MGLSSTERQRLFLARLKAWAMTDGEARIAALENENAALRAELVLAGKPRGTRMTPVKKESRHGTGR